MKILNKLTITSLKLNKKRTLVTAIGIILSTALITVVAGMVTSASGTLKEYFKSTNGDYHVEFKNVPISELSYIEENRNIKEYFLSSNLGYSNLKESKNEFKPYVYITAYDSAGLSKMPIKLKEGRLPENSSELVISNSIINNANVYLKVGDKISFDISKRLLDGKELSQDDILTEDEELEKIYTKEYLIVGIMERLNFELEPYSSPGYSVITYLDTNNLKEKANIYTKYTKEALNNYEKVTCNILGINVEGDINYSEMYEVTFKEDLSESNSKYGLSINTSLLNFEGVGINDSYVRMLYLIGIIVIVIIIIASVFVIRNSFAISITERTRQYGMLSSVGATKKQIRKNVLFEGLVLGVIAIPCGILLGIFVNLILSIILNNLIRNIIEEINFIYQVPIIAILFSILLAGVTIYLSCLSSARKASKVSPIEAIRSSNDIKIKGKKVKSPKIIKKIFGIGGEIAYKNLKRSKKKYRTTVISIVVSIMIFISVTSLVQYGFVASNSTYKEIKYNISVYAEKSEDEEQNIYEQYKQITQLDTVKEFAITKTLYADIKPSELKYTEEGKVHIGYQEDKMGEDFFELIQIVSLGNEEYLRYIKDLGLNYDYAKNKVILVDDFKTYRYNKDGSYKKQIGEIYDYKPGEKINLYNISSKEGVNREIEVATTTSKKPMGYEDSGINNGFMVVSEEFINQYDNYLGTLYIKSKDAGKLEQEILKNYTNMSVFNIEREAKAQNSLILIIAIFLYGFIIVISLIGITNIFNTITSNMNLRSKEFANLKSIGMTKKEFNRMIRLESIFYGTKSIIIGVPLGIVGSYLLYKAFNEGIGMGEYEIPLISIIASIIAVFVLIGGIMKYSLNKINKQNIIETIRKENI